MLTDDSQAVQLIKHVSKLTVATAQKGQQLSAIRRESEEIAIAAISAAIAGLNNAINVGQKMNEMQIIETAYTILELYWMLKIDEILLCFNMIKTGKMGKVYGLDQPKIMHALNIYDTVLKANYYKSIEPLHPTRTREKETKPVHVALTVEDMNELIKK